MIADSYNPFDHSILDTIRKYCLLNHTGMKRLGQNFLCDENLLDKIAKLAGELPSDTTIVEIGPGPCGLTKSILRKFPNNQIVCIEKDVRFKPLHDRVLQYCDNLHFVYADALNYNLCFNKMAIIANLPYNIGTILLVKWLTSYINNISKMVLLFQKEVADRICAKQSTKQYGSVSVLAQLLCNVSSLFDISNKAFIPHPKIMSSVVVLTPKNESNMSIDNLRPFANFVKTVFQFRRKIIGSTIEKLYPDSNTNEILSYLNIDKTRRPETITPKEYFSLYNEIIKRSVF